MTLFGLTLSHKLGIFRLTAALILAFGAQMGAVWAQNGPLRIEITRA